MKKSIIFTLAAAFLALTACQKEASSPAVARKAITFQAGDIETRTVFGTPDGTTYPTLWTDADIQAGISLNLSSTDKVAADVTPSADGKTASFKAVFDNPATAESYTFVAFYPNSVVKSVNASNRTLNIEFPAGQTSTATTPDENAQIIYAVSETFTELPDTDIPLSFKHASAYLHLVFQNAAIGSAVVSAVNLTASTKIAGRWFFNLEDKTISENATGNTISIATETLESVWCALAPTDLSGATLKFVINTDKGTLTKEITLPADRSLTPGSIKKLTVDLAGVPLQEPVVYKLVKNVDELYFGDQVIIVSDGEIERALGATQNNNNRSAADIVKEGDYIYNPSDAVQQLSLEEGAIPGMFSFKALTGSQTGYLYAPGGGNYLRTQAAKDAAATFAVTIAADGTKIIGQKAGISQNEMRYNNNTNSDGSVNNLFSCYATSSSCKPVVLYRKDVDPIDAEQYFNVTLPGTNTVSAGAHTVEIYVFGNVAWTAAATDGASLDKTSGNSSQILTLTIPENTSSSTVSHEVTVTTTASVSPQSFTIDITQAAASGEAVPVGTILWKEDWEGGAANDTPSAYIAKTTATTVVYNSGTVTYSQSGTGIKLYADYLVYVKNGYSGSNPLPEGKKMNLFISKSNGWWSISGIPCKNVAKAKITFHSNYGTAAYSNLSTTTEGVTIGAFSTTNYTSDWEKKVYVNSHVITFSGTAETFDLKFTNTNTSNNVRVDDITLEVIE